MTNSHATVEELLARIAKLNERKSDLNEKKIRVNAAFKAAQEDRDENVTHRRWNAEDIRVAKDELKAAKAARKAEKAQAKANKPKRQTKAQREQEEANRFYANERNNDFARAQAEERAREEAEAERMQANYREQVRRMREQNEAARRVREEAERVRAAQEAQTQAEPLATKWGVFQELLASFGLVATWTTAYGETTLRTNMNSAELRAVRMAFVKANAAALNNGDHAKLAIANAILDELCPIKAARQAAMEADNMERQREARAARDARRSEWFV